MVSDKAWSAFRREAREKAEATARAKLDTDAQARGFNDHASMLTYLDGVRAKQPPVSGRPNQGRPNGSGGSPPPRQPEDPPQPANRNDRKATERFQQEIAKAKREAERAAREVDAEKKRRRHAERERDAIETETTLCNIARRQGVQDVDLAIDIYKRYARTLTDEERAKLDEAEYFKGLRATRPYLFNEVVIPPTTGTTGTPPGSLVPRPATPLGGTPPGVPDAMKMSRQEFSRHEQARGVRRTTTGLG